MKKKEIILLHLLLWILIFNLFVMANLPRYADSGFSEFVKFLRGILENMGMTLILFYSAYFTLNFFIRKPKRFLWIAGFFVLAILIMFTGYTMIGVPGHGALRQPSLMKLIFAICEGFMLFSLVFFGFLFRLGIQGIQNGKRNRQLEKEKLTTQLELIKSQINPHFLFNTLNNIDILIKEDAGRASQYLNKLSDILRYSIYETKQETVAVETEIENMQKYVELQKIRTQNPGFAELTVTGDFKGLMIAPMVFLPFLENAFKHSTNKKIDKAIVIKMLVENGTIWFDCKNHCAEVFQPDENSSGMGMNLIRSRFDLLFKDRYTMENKKGGDWYEVNLKIQLNDH